MLLLGLSIIGDRPCALEYNYPRLAFKFSQAADPQLTTAIEGRRGAGVLGGNAIVVHYGEFGFE